MSVNKVNNDGSLKRIAGGTLYADAPLGTILAFGGTTAPAGWMLCQGQALSRTTYAKLFAIIGTAFGTGDGSTTFNIPDLRGEFLRGAGTNGHSGQGNGGSVGQHQDATEIGNTYGIGAGTLGWTVSDNTIQNADKSISGTVQGLTGDSQRATIGNAKFLGRPTNTSVNYIIKVMMVSLPTDLNSAVDAKIAAKGVYSTSEVDTGKTWIDGKPIYRKVLDFGVLPNTADKYVDAGITNLAAMIEMKGIAYTPGYSTIVPIPFAEPGIQANQMSLYYTSGNVHIATKIDRSNFSAYIIFEYTKT